MKGIQEQSMAKKNDKYFDQFVEMGEYCCQAAKKLEEILTHYDHEALPETIREMHAIEQDGDHVRHNVTRALAKEFITPIEREDIMMISSQIDTVLDKLEDVVMKLYMFDIKEIRDDALVMAELLVRCTAAMKDALVEFHHFKKSQAFREMVVEINNLEEEGDRLYMEAVRSVWLDPYTPPERIYAWTQVYDYMERVSDACEDVGDLVEHVVMKNT
jgi:predicted phosphate transport protein (TIGR00153 family)